MMGIPRCDGALVPAPLPAAMSLGGAAMVVGVRKNKTKKSITTKKTLKEGARPNRPKISVTANKLLKDRIFSDFLCIFAALVMGLLVGLGAARGGVCRSPGIPREHRLVLRML